MYIKPNGLRNDLIYLILNLLHSPRANVPLLGHFDVNSLFLCFFFVLVIKVALPVLFHDENIFANVKENGLFC